MKDDTSVADALDLFAKRDIISAPVTDHSGAFCGVINLIDIVCNLAVEKWDCFSAPVSKLLGLSQEGKGLAVYEATERVKTALKSLSTIGPGRHLALVRGKGWHRVITQTDIMRCLLNTSEFNQMKDQPVAVVAKEFLCKPIGIGHKDTAMKGLQLMAVHNFDSVPVLDSDGSVVETLTSCDLTSNVVRSSEPETLSKLFSRNVLDFVATVRQDRRNKSVMKFHTEKSFKVLVKEMISTEARQVWLIREQDGKLVNVLSQGDILSLFA